MTADYIVIAVGLIVSIIGYLMRPTELGWFLLGFGVAHVILGILDSIFHNPERIEQKQP
jgi:hypothetical protein